MKIAITGTHRVGKTTLAEKLQMSLDNYVYQQEPYFELEEIGHPFSDTPGFDDFSVQLTYSIKQLSIKESNIIFDRCPLDLLAYIHAIGDPEAAEQLYPKVETAMAAIDLLVFVPVENPDLITCPDHELPVLREEVNELLHAWVMDLDIAVVQVTGTIAERVDQVIRSI
jgi:predicted ATPase